MFRLMDPQRRAMGDYPSADDAKQAAADQFGEVTLTPVGDPDTATTHLVHNANGEMVGQIQDMGDEPDEPTPLESKKPRRKGK